MLCGNVVKASPPAPLQRGEGSEMLCGLTGERVERWKGERVKRWKGERVERWLTPTNLSTRQLVNLSTG